MNEITHLGKGDPIAILEAMPSLVQTGDDSLGVLRDARHHRGNGLNAIRIVDGKLFAEIAKDLREQTSRLGNDQSDSVAVRELGDASLFRRQRIGQHDDAELQEEVLRQRFGVDSSGHVVVEIRQLDAGDFRSVLAHIVLGQIELSGKVFERRVDCVVQRHRLHSAQDHVLGHFHSQTAETADQHVRGGHATHRIVAQDVQLTRVQTLVDVARRSRRGPVRSVSSSGS